MRKDTLILGNLWMIDDNISLAAALSGPVI